MTSRSDSGPSATSWVAYGAFALGVAAGGHIYADVVPFWYIALGVLNLLVAAGCAVRNRNWRRAR